MELKDTVEGMLSDDYKERFVAEYQQVAIRERKLSNLIDDWVEGKLDFKPTSPYGLLVAQQHTMCEYLDQLQRRAELEHIDLGGAA